MSNWTDERIAEELGTIANENFDYPVILRMTTTIVPLMRQMRDEMRVEYAALSDGTVLSNREVARLLQENEILVEENGKLIAELVEMRQIQDDLTASHAAELDATTKNYDELYNRHYATLAWAERAYIALSESTQHINIGVDVLADAPADVRS